MLCLIAVTSWRHRAIWPSAPYILLASISVAALLLGYTLPQFEPPEPVLAIVRFLDIPHLPLVWLFALSVCVPEFRLRTWHIVVCFFYATPILWPRLHLYGVMLPPPDWLLVYGAITSVMLVGHLLVTVALAVRRNSGARPSAHMVGFSVVLLSATIGAALAEVVPDEALISRQTAKIIAIFPALAFGAFWMLRLRIPALVVRRSVGDPAGLSHRNLELLTSVERYLLVEEGYRDHRLTIAKLAGEVGVSQDRLRRLINRELGYANFNAYINAIRVDAVRRRFADPGSSDEPILTLAIDAGFKSVSVFNKAFKSATGQTPSHYRARIAHDTLSERDSEGFSRNQ